MKALARKLDPHPSASVFRREHLRDALGNAALEGIKPRPQALADLKAVVGGNLTADQYRQRVKTRYGLQR